MKVRDDIAQLLHAGVPQIQIARQLHCAQITIQRTREALGLPAPGRGRRPAAATLEEAFRAHLEPTDDGHVRWTGAVNSYGSPKVTANRETQSAYRIAFTLHHGREPVGRVTAGCGLQGCVRGDHIADQPMRQANQRADRAFAAIFGGAP